MALTSNDCKQYIVSWYKNNPNALPLSPFTLGQYATDGLSAKDWSRCAKGSSGNSIYRAFEPRLPTKIEVGIIVVLTEENGVITNLEFGDRDQFEGPGKYFKKVLWPGIGC